MYIGSYRLENILSVLPVVFIVAFFIISFWQNRNGSSQSWGGPSIDTSDKTPEDILKERFARGDIDEAEYRSRMDILKKDR
jgi:putative membrane protein